MMYDLSKLKLHFQDKGSIYWLPKEEFRDKILQELRQAMFGKRTIFLDLNFWINFRDGKTSHRLIYTKLKSLVVQDKVACVLSSSIIDEIGKMPFDKRLETARIVDSLNCRVVLNNIKIASTEMINLDKALSGERLIENYQFSPIFESNPFLSESALSKFRLENDFIGNLFYEDMLSMSVEEYCIATNSEYRDSSTNFTKLFNEIKTRELSTPIYLNVLIEGLKSQMHVFQRHFDYKFKNAIDVSKSLSMFKQHAPFTYTLSALIASMGIDRDRLIKTNDYFDLMHSCVGAGYTDYFFTEKKFHHLLKTKPVDILTEFKVKVGSGLDEILTMLAEIE